MSEDPKTVGDQPDQTDKRSDARQAAIEEARKRVLNAGEYGTTTVRWPKDRTIKSGSF